MIKVAIIEDNDQDAESLINEISRYSKENKIDITYQRFSNPILFLDKYEPNFDVVFFDIMMPLMNGIEASKKLRKLDEEIIIIFLTSLAQFAIEGYSVQALDYIIKPLNYFDFAMKFSRILPRIKKKEVESLVVKTKQGNQVININDIIYIESIGHNLNYHLFNKDTLEERNTLKNIEAKLSRYNFSRCNSCYLVNLKYITLISGYKCYLNDIELAISQPRKKQFLEEFNNYLLGH